jgi:tetratricopeptide (TPR) repeat protein
MSNLKSKQNSKQPVKTGNPKAQALPVKSDAAKRKNIILIIVAIAITAVVYSISLKNGWIKNWDDGGYVTEHESDFLSAKDIHNLTSDDLSRMFTSFYKGNYHPLTTLFYAIEYRIVGDSPFLYHLNNLIIHLLNVFLVFVFVRLLTKKQEIAFIAAVLFGIHPMHVESVAWISERKDVMYGFFFLLSMIYYFYYLTKKENKKRNYIIALCAFLFSSLSKSAAVTLPVVLLLIDYYMKRKWEKKIIIEKIPFFAISLAFGVMAVMSQGSAGAIQDLTPLYSWLERPILASYSTMMYLFKLVVPIDLSAMYPYPDRIGGFLPRIFYIAPVVLLMLAFLVYISRKFNRDIIFGTLFFLVTISLVLQLLPVGGAILAERYTYIPYIGLFMIIGKGYVFSQEDKSKFAKWIKWLYPALIFIGIVIFSIMTFQRIKQWKDGEVLFTDVIKKYPNLPFAYNNRGYLYFNFLKKYDKALADYNKCLEIDSTFHRALSNRGVLYYNFYGDNKSDSLHLALAVKDFTKALKYSNDNTDALIGRANSYSTQKRFDLSLPDYNRYIQLDQKNAKAYLWRGTAYYNLEKYDKALVDFNKCIAMTPNDDNAYLWRGLYYYQVKDYASAIKDFDKSLQLNPKQSDAYSWRGLSEFRLNLFDKAIADYTTALQINPNDAPTYINRSSAYFELKNYEQSFKDYCSAGDLRYALNKEYFFKLKALAGK